MIRRITETPEVVRPPREFSCGNFTIGELSVWKRQVFLEAYAEPLLDEALAVWMFVGHWSESASQLAGTVGRDAEGRLHVYVNMLTAKCPLLRVGILRHELEHVRAGDLERPKDQHQEARCEVEAGLAIQGLLRRIESKIGGCTPNVAECQRCYLGKLDPCPQGQEVFAAVRQALPNY